MFRNSISAGAGLMIFPVILMLFLTKGFLKSKLELTSEDEFELV